MQRSLRILVAEDDPALRNYYEAMLPFFGHQVIGVVDSGLALVEQCLALLPDLVISDVKLPELDGLEAAARVHRERPTPFIIVSGFDDPELLRRASDEHILAYLVKPITQATLEAEIITAMRRFEEFQAVRAESPHDRQALADRKLIERAKEIVCKQTGKTEPAAFAELQSRAAAGNRRLIDVAREVLDASQSVDLELAGSPRGGRPA